MPNERYGHYLSIDTPWVSVGQVVWTPQPSKVGQLSEKFKNAEKCTFFTSAKNLFMAHFFSKCYNSMTDKDISMKPTANGHKFPKFSMAGSRAKISESTFELFYLEQWTQLAQKFWPLLRDPGPG